jgi:membrane associated rhomboid family serine protease
MGIYDRDYYRREGPSFLGSFVDRGKVCKYLIGINIVFFVVQLLAPHATQFDPRRQEDVPYRYSIFTTALDLNPDAVLHGQVWRLITHAFLHEPIGFPWHILFNMLFLWWFGKEVEDLYGSKEFLAFYLFGAFFSGVCFLLVAIIVGDPTPALGASGAITAVLIVYAFHYPSRIIYIWLLPIPIWLFVAFCVFKDLFGLVGTLQGVSAGTAFAGHLGGAAFGFAYFKQNWRVSNWLPDLSSWRRNQVRRRSKLRVYREDEPMRTPVAVAAPPTFDVDEQLEAKLDAVLQKVSQSGRDSLTDSERQILVRASEIYKKRRS